MIVETLVHMDDTTCCAILAQVLQRRPDLAPDVVSRAVPDLTYAPTRAITDRRCIGIVKSVSKQTGHSLIMCPDLFAVFGVDVYVHAKQGGNLVEGQRVNFAVTLTKDSKPQAFDVMPVDGGCGAGAKNAGTAYMGSMGMGDAATGMANMGGTGVGASIDGTADMSGMDSMSAMAGMAGMDNSGCNGMASMAAMDGMQGMQGMHGAMVGRDGCMASMGMGDAWGGDMGMYGDSAAMGGKKGGGKGNQQVVGEFFGVIKTYNVDKGFGFIACDALKEQFEGDVYLHQKHVGEFQVGSEVRFQAYLHNGRLQGRDLRDASGQVGPQQGSGAGGQPLGNFIGVLKTWNPEKGYGFIKCDDINSMGYGGDVFVNQKNIGNFQVGSMVGFTVYNLNGKVQARDLVDAAEVSEASVGKKQRLW